MINLYTWATPNGRKISIMLEELGLDYTVSPVDLGKLEQSSEAFSAISPNQKIPAIVDNVPDQAPVVVFESGAILTYLAEKTGQLLAPQGQARYQALEWLHWQTSALGPILGQLGFFAIKSQEKSPLAIQRFSEEAERLLAVMEKHLSSHAYLAGEAYSIADIACYPWVLAASEYFSGVLTEGVKAKPALLRWLTTIQARPAVARGMLVPQR